MPGEGSGPPVGPLLGVDVGATKLAVGLVGPGGELLERALAPTTGADDAGALFARLEGTIRSLSGWRSARACGVGAAGPIDLAAGTVSPLNTPVWRSFPLRDRLAAAIGLPTSLELDAKALALGEGWVGRAAGRRDYLAMVVSTGVGAGLVVDGRMLDGASGNAGHIGHVIVEPEGRPCACGARGCLEAEASGPAVAAWSGRRPEEAEPATVSRVGRLVGRGVASVANLLDLPLALVAGSVALGFGPPFFAAAQAELDASCRLAFSRGARIEPAGLGERGPLIGAAAVARRSLLADPGAG